MNSQRLWEPFKLGPMELRNRIVMPPMVTRYGDKDGNVTERTRRYYEARARGGAGLIVVEATSVEQRGQISPNQLKIIDDRFILGMRELVDTIHRHGAMAAIQLHHGGRTAKSELALTQPVAPSPIPMPGEETPRELTIAEIKEIVVSFAEAAVRAKKAGFDGVELHAANNYLIAQFISSSSNKRQDSYGGELRNRVRFLIEIIETIKVAVGRDFCVWPRMNGREYGVEGGTTLGDAKQIAKMAQDAGADAIHVRSAGPAAPDRLPSRTFRPATTADLAESIKKVVTVPVIASGMITPEAGESLIAEGKADLVAIGRGLLADPELPNKGSAGRIGDINPCILCNNCGNDLRTPSLTGIRCTVNAALGKEAEDRISSTDHSKNILVIGGGPAGMEAARVAALRGHRVTLWEKADRLGGQLLQASVLSYKDRIEVLTRYFERQLENLDVHVEKRKEATATGIMDFGPDTVVLATGIKPFIPDIPGMNRVRVVQVEELLGYGAEVGDRVAVIGGELVGCETAEFLAEKGKKVTVIRRGPEMALGAMFTLRPWLLDRLRKIGVTLLPGVTYHEITPSGIVVTTKEGERKVIGADTIVLAAGSVPNNGLYEELKGKVKEIHLAGDCVRPRLIREAISEGYRIGLKI
jgi:2,4-dienoyl-CoA reductase-like NADH-dependent reductase (Old Yellow Enzyme family)/thioredoxin reductase